MRTILNRTMPFLLAALLTFCLAACGKDKTTEEPAAPETGRGSWMREGNFQDENDNLLAVVYGKVDYETGWYVICMFDEDTYAGLVRVEKKKLSGTIPGEEAGEITVELTEEGEDGVKLTVEGGEEYHFTPMRGIPEITVHIDIDGVGKVNYAESDQLIEFDDYPYEYTVIELDEPATYVLSAQETDPEWKFVKWTRNDEDLTTEKTFIVDLTEDEVFVAVFEYVPEE